MVRQQMKYYCNIAQYLIAVQGYILGLERYMTVSEKTVHSAINFVSEVVRRPWQWLCPYYNWLTMAMPYYNCCSTGITTARCTCHITTYYGSINHSVLPFSSVNESLALFPAESATKCFLPNIHCESCLCTNIHRNASIVGRA